MFAMALAVAAYLARSFLVWKATGERMRVLFVDGEMPRTLMQHSQPGAMHDPMQKKRF